MYALIIPRPSRKISMEKNLVKRRSQGTRLRKTRSHRTITGPQGDVQHHHPASRKIIHGSASSCRVDQPLWHLNVLVKVRSR